MGKGRVLAVDAYQPYVRWLAEGLASWGFHVQPAYGAESALAMIEGFGPGLLVVDAFLPQTGGPGLVQTIRSRSPRDVGVLYTVDEQMMGAVAHDTALVLDDFVVKSPNIQEVANRLRRAQRRLQHLPELMQEIQRMSSGYGGIHTPRRKRLVVMFTDVRNFTRYSSNRDPETVASALNELFEVQAQAVHRYGGHVDKFIGDGMMALFGLRDSDRDVTTMASRALSAARDIVRGVEEATSVSLMGGEALDVGIGMHCGAVVVGPIGSRLARDFTAIGDDVNFASRLCSKAAAGQIIVSDDMLKICDGQVELLSTTREPVKGKTDIHSLHEIAVGNVFAV